MSAFALVNEYVALNGGATINDHVKSAVLTLDAAQLDSTAMGDSWTKAIGGLKSGTLALTFNDDMAASNVDSLLWSYFNSGTAITFEVRADAGAVSATNPKYTGSVLPVQFTIGGQVGDLAAKTVTFPVTGAVARATS
jgi:hypothetical protein